MTNARASVPVVFPAFTWLPRCSCCFRFRGQHQCNDRNKKPRSGGRGRRRIRRAGAAAERLAAKAASAADEMIRAGSALMAVDAQETCRRGRRGNSGLKTQFRSSDDDARWRAEIFFFVVCAVFCAISPCSLACTEGRFFFFEPFSAQSYIAYMPTHFTYYSSSLFISSCVRISVIGCSPDVVCSFRFVACGLILVCSHRFLCRLLLRFSRPADKKRAQSLDTKPRCSNRQSEEMFAHLFRRSVPLNPQASFSRRPLLKLSVNTHRAIQLVPRFKFLSPLLAHLTRCCIRYVSAFSSSKKIK